MPWPPCPICKTENPPNSLYCSSCGADFTDPDVAAMAPSASQSLGKIGEAGELSASKFLGFGHEGLIDGRGVQLLGLIFGAVLLVGFVIPVTKIPLDYDRVKEKWIFENLMTWDVWDMPNISKLGMMLPLILGGLGIAVAAVPKIPVQIRAGALTLFGLVGLFLSAGAIGGIVGDPERTLSLLNVGLLVTGVAAIARVLLPQSPHARKALVVGAGLVVLGYLLPLGEVGTALPAEYRKWAPAMEIDLSGGVTLVALAKGLDRQAGELLFTSFVLLLPFLAAPAAAWFGWKPAAGPWDKGSLVVRPLAWLLVLAIPAAYALLAFNAVGFSAGEDAVLLGRLRVLVVVTACVMWVEIGGFALFDWVLRRKS